MAYVAFHSTIIERTTRAERAKIYLHNYDAKQQEFLNFVLKQYINSGIYELDEEKLSPLLLLKYNAINDAKKALGDIATIRKTFIGFQGYLYISHHAGFIGKKRKSSIAAHQTRCFSVRSNRPYLWMGAVAEAFVPVGTE